MDSIQAWEIFAQLGVKGETELKQKLQDITALANSTQAALDKLGIGKPATSVAGSEPAVAGGKAAPLQTSMLYGGGTGGGNWGGGQGASNSPTSPAGGPAAVGGGAGGGGGGIPIQTKPAGGAGDGGWEPMKTFTMGGGLVAESNKKAAAEAAAKVAAEVPMKTFLMGQGDAARAIARDKSGAFAGGVPTGAGDAARAISRDKVNERLAELGKKSKEAGDTIGQLGLRHAWIIRSATAGGPLGMLGGGLGAGIGGLMGNMGFGALMGNMLGQMITSGVGRMHGAVGEFSPASAKRFERAQADLSASFGQILIPTMERTTTVTRQFADIVAGVGPGLAAATEVGFGKLRNMPLIGDAMAAFTNFANQPGIKDASQGKGISPLAGKTYTSADALYRDVASMVMMYSDKGPGSTPSAAGPRITEIPGLLPGQTDPRSDFFMNDSSKTPLIPRIAPGLLNRPADQFPGKTNEEMLRDAINGRSGAMLGGGEDLSIMNKAISDHLSFRVTT